MLASTSSVYGGNTKVPFAELDRAAAPVSLYAATKKAGEALAHSYAAIHGIPTTAFRFFTVYGPWGRPDMALFKFVSAILDGRAIDVYGHGRMRRDFTYIDDLVTGICALSERAPQVGHPVSPADSLSSVAPFRVVNVGGGNPVGLQSFIEAIEAALDMQAQKNFLPMQPGDMIQTYADPQLLKDLTGVQLTTPVSVGVARFVEWFKSYYANKATLADASFTSN